jgi:hypothetical protein
MKRRTFLRAAATAMAMIEADEIRPRGALAQLFRPEPIAAGDLPYPVPSWPDRATAVARGRGGRGASSSESLFKECHQLASGLIMLSRHDPATARELRDLLRFGRRDPGSLAGVDALLNELGIPVPEDVT